MCVSLIICRVGVCYRTCKFVRYSECPLLGVSAIREFLKYGVYGKSSWYIAYCPLYGRCPLFGVSAIREFLKYGVYGKSSWYIAYCPLYGRCPLFGVSAKRGSTVLVLSVTTVLYL